MTDKKLKANSGNLQLGDVVTVDQTNSRLGVGTPSPGTLLDVAGAVTLGPVSDSISHTLNGSVIVTTAPSNPFISSAYKSIGSNGSQILFSDGTTTANEIYIFGGGYYNGASNYSQNSNTAIARFGAFGVTNDSSTAFRFDRLWNGTNYTSTAQTTTLNTTVNLGLVTSAGAWELGPSGFTGEHLVNGNIVLDHTAISSAGSYSLIFRNTLNRNSYIRADYNSSAGGNGTALAIGTNANGADGVDAVTIANDGAVTLASNIRSVGRSTSYGNTNGTATGGLNVLMGVSNSATWLISGTSGGTFRGGIQLLDAGGDMRIYVDTNSYLSIADSGYVNQILLDGGGVVRFNDHVVPHITNTYDLGSPTSRWRTIYSVNALNTSDERLKKDINTLPSMLPKLLTLQPRSFSSAYDTYEVGKEGFVAQEYATVFPEDVVEYTEEIEGLQQVKGIQTTGMAWEARLVKAIQELNAKVEALEAQITS